LIKNIIYIAAIFFLHSIAAAQQYYLKGDVKDEAGKPLQNVSIIQGSTGYLYYSGQDGSFGLVLNRKKDTLTFFTDGFQKQKVLADATNYTKIKLKRQQNVSTSRYNLSSLTENLKREAQQQWFLGDETYASIIENQFINTASYPSTGVTLNIDRASYSNVRRFLNMNTQVPTDAVRIEEMLNYFNFNYAEPSNNKTFDIYPVLTDCPWNPANQLLLTTIRSKKISLDSLPATNLVFLIDVSGSMDMPNRLPLLKSSFRGLVNNLRAKDSVSIVAYGGLVAVLLDATSGAEKEKIFNVIDSLEPGGSTPGESGIKLAYSVARNHFIKNGNNRVVLATDGDFNVGLKSETDLEDLIKEQSKTGIYLTCLGVGMGNYKDSKIQVLAQKGNGNFAYLDSYAEAEKVLMKEFMQTFFAVADDAYLNVQFNPEYVKEYRLIGFENKMGAIKDSMATIEGGAIGSAYSMLVAFEIVSTNMSAAKGLSVQPAKFSLKYKMPKATNFLEETNAPFMQKKTLTEIDKNYQFAVSVIMFSSLLRDSRNVKAISWNEINALATVSADLSIPSQKEFLLLIQKAKTIYSKKKKGKNFKLFN
jgi:Ca-activated chloride channel family protein